MKLDLRWLALFISSLCVHEGLQMLNFALAPYSLYLYLPALFLGYSGSFVSFKLGFLSTVLLGLALEAKGSGPSILLPLLISFCVLHYRQTHVPDKSRRRLRGYLQPLNLILWSLWVFTTQPVFFSFVHNPLPLVLSLCLSQALLWSLSLWYMDLQHRLIVPLQKRLKPSN